MRLATFVATLGALGGCISVDGSTRGASANRDQVRKIQEGISGREDVMKTLGPPTSMHATSVREVWVYRAKEESSFILLPLAVTSSSREIEVRVEFDLWGVVRRVERRGS